MATRNQIKELKIKKSVLPLLPIKAESFLPRKSVWEDVGTWDAMLIGSDGETIIAQGLQHFWAQYIAEAVNAYKPPTTSEGV